MTPAYQSRSVENHRYPPITYLFPLRRRFRLGTGIGDLASECIGTTPRSHLIERQPPEPGQIARVRQRLYFVEQNRTAGVRRRQHARPYVMR